MKSFVRKRHWERAVVFQLSFCCHFLKGPKLAAKKFGGKPHLDGLRAQQASRGPALAFNGVAEDGWGGKMPGEKLLSRHPSLEHLRELQRKAEQVSGHLLPSGVGSAPQNPPAGVTPTRTRAIKRPPQCKVGFDSSIGFPHLLS